MISSSDSWPLMSLATVLDGGLFIDGDWVETKDQDPQGDVRLIQLADVGDGVFNDRSNRFLTAEKAAELKCTYLERGDVLVARMPDPLGRAAVYSGLDQPAITVVDVCILRPADDGPRPEWLMHMINSPQSRLAMHSLSRGTTRGRISRKNLGKLVIPVPRRDVQDALIAEVDAALKRLSRSGVQLDEARITLNRIRRGVLAKAFRGDLTPTGRDL